MAYNVLNDNSLETQQELDAIALADADLAKTSELRKEYADSIASEPFFDSARANEIVNADLFKPIFRDYNICGEDLPKRLDLIQIAMDSAVDMASIDHSIINSANKYTKLISSTIQRLNAIKERLHRNEQRIKDIDFIRNAYTGIGNIVPINKDNMSGEYTLSNNTFSCYANSIMQILFDVENVSGNGYIGNGYVLDDNGNFLQETNDRSNVENISDNSLLTVFEYSRLCTGSQNYYYNKSQRPEDTSTAIADVMYDNKDAVCTITMHTKNESGFNMLVLDTDMSEIVIQDIQISSDGKTYTHVTNKEKNADTSAKSLNYVPGSNTVYFPTTQYVKLTLSSSYSNPEEKLGRTYTEVTDSGAFTTIRPLANVHRKVISLGGIRAYNNRYKDSVMATYDLAPKNGCKSVAIFANQYIPEQHLEHGKTECVKYELIVNGIAHEVEPVNSDKNGYKIISCSKDSYGDAAVLFIDEPIRTVHVQITMKKLTDNMSPIVGNLKLCIG